MAPPQAALTPAPATMNTVVFAASPVNKPLTLPSKVTVNVIVSPALLPAVPATALPTDTLGAVLLNVGAVVSTLKPVLSATNVWVNAALLPAASRTTPPLRLSASAAKLIPSVSV